MSPKIWQSDLGTWGSEIQKHNNIPNTKAYFTSTHQYELWHLSHLSFTVLIPVLVSILQCWCSLFLLPESQTTWFWLLLTSAQYVCWSCSPPAANWALVVNYQFWQPTFPCWLRAPCEKGGLFVSWHHYYIEDCLTRLTDSSTRAGTDCTDLQLIGGSVADCQALTWRPSIQHE